MNCPYCNNKIITDGGVGSAPFIVVGRDPSWKDVQMGYTFAGLYGSIMQTEFSLAGLSLDLGLYTNFWLHELNPKYWEEPDHLAWHRKQLDGKLQNVQYALFLGTDLARIYHGEGVSSIEGIPTRSILYPDLECIFLSDPASLLRGGVGEFRLGIQKFARMMNV